MEQLILSQNHIILSKIFLFLDPSSLKNARCVCRAWNDYILRNIWQYPIYREVLSRRLDDKWSHPTTWRPATRSFRCKAAAFDLVADEKEIVVSLETGEIQVWDRFTLDLKYTIAEAGNNHGLRLGLNDECLIGGFFDSLFTVWSRKHPGKSLFKQKTDSNIHGLRAISKDKLVVSSVNGDISIYALSLQRAEVCLTLVGGCRGPSLFDTQDNWLVHTFHRRQLVLFDLSLERRVRQLARQDGPSIWSVKMHFPLAITTGRTASDASGIHLWDLVHGTQVLQMRVDGVESVDIDARRIIVQTETDLLVTIIRDSLRQPEQQPQDSLRFQTLIRLPECNRSDLISVRLEPDQAILQVDSSEGRFQVLNFWFAQSESSPTADEAKSSRSGSWLQRPYKALSFAVSWTAAALAYPVRLISGQHPRS